MRRSRAPFRTPAERPRFVLPGKARLAVHAIVNVEDWLYDRKLPRSVLSAPGGFEPLPDVPNFAWYQYGMRVGIWRTLGAFAKHGARATLSLNASVCTAYPQIVAETERAGWEIMAHGVSQRALPSVPDERAEIREALDICERATGKRPRGWLGPGLVESFESADLLASEGLVYCCDWGAADDVPYALEVASGTLVAVPYPVEMNDIVIFGLERRPDDAMLDRGRRHFDVLYRESSAEAPLVMAFALHPWICGVPHRIDLLDTLLGYLAAHDGVRFMTGGEIADAFLASAGAAAR